MANEFLLEHSERELPSHFADRLGIVYSSSVDVQHKKENGQFFTPIEIAAFMASFSEFSGHFVRILDPGCGSGILSCSLLERLVDSCPNLESVKLVAYETDAQLIPIANHTLSYLTKWLRARGVECKFILHAEDFIKHNRNSFREGDLFSETAEQFDIIISNPPYFKLPITDERAQIGKVVIDGHPNIYAIFMALSARLLKNGGELIFITPRSYAAGRYFRSFREYFFGLVDLERAHLFVSRKDTFQRDKVLQETVIIKASAQGERGTSVEVTSSSGLKDLGNPSRKIFSKDMIIDLRSREKILYLPTTDYEEELLMVFRNWKGNFSTYNIKVSTGPVVAFRALEFLSEKPAEGDDKYTVPLFWLHNVNQMFLQWPIDRPGKEQYLKVDEISRSLVIENKNYVFLRRFSSKDDKNRLIAAPYFSNHIKFDSIGVENKLNYIYRPGGHLSRSEVVGICGLLNSKVFDDYFRIFNGNVNVSASELKNMPLPPLAEIQEIGDTIILSNDFSVDNVNAIVNQYIQPVYTP